MGAGYEHHWNSWTFGLNNSIQFTYLGIPEFTQTVGTLRTLDVRMERQTAASLVYTLGGNISYCWEIAPNYQVQPTIGIYWQHEFLNYGQRIASRLANGKGIPFYFNSQSGNRNNAFATAGMTAQVGRHFGTFVYYTPQFGGNQIYSNAIIAGANLSF